MGMVKRGVDRHNPTSSSSSASSLAPAPASASVPTSALVPMATSSGSLSAQVVNRKDKLKLRMRRFSERGRRILGLDQFRDFSLNVTELERLQIKPVVVFINKKSGGKLGKVLVDVFSNILPGFQVCDLSKHRPSEYLSFYKGLTTHANSTCGLRLVCCGGDGTVAWVRQEAERLQLEDVTMSVVPLGTGNDLYGVLLEEAEQFLKRNPALLEAGAKLRDISDDVAKIPLRALDSFEWSPLEESASSSVFSSTSSFKSEISNEKKGSLTVDDFCVPLDTWEISIARRHRQELSNHDLEELHMQVQVQTEAEAEAETEAETGAETSVTTEGKSISNDVERALTEFFDDDKQRKLSWQDRVKQSVPSIIGRHSQKKSLNNYFGIGVDGYVSMKFAELRKEYPRLFFSSIINKLWYLLVGVQTYLSRHQTDLSNCVYLMCDGKKVDIPPGTQGIIVLNINSYAGGVKLWQFADKDKEKSSTTSNTPPMELSNSHLDDGMNDNGKWKACSMHDRVVEVVAVKNMLHLGQVRAGMGNLKPIAQCSQLDFVTNQTLHMQVDGEPWVQRASHLKMRWTGQASMLLPIALKSKIRASPPP